MLDERVVLKFLQGKYFEPRGIDRRRLSDAVKLINSLNERDLTVSNFGSKVICLVKLVTVETLAACQYMCFRAPFLRSG